MSSLSLFVILTTLGESCVTLAILYGDIVTDILVNVKYYNDGDTGWFAVGMVCLLLSYGISMLFGIVMFVDPIRLTDKSFYNRIVILLVGFLWLSPVVPLYDIIVKILGRTGVFTYSTSAASQSRPSKPGENDDQIRITLKLRAIFKGGEMLVESIPQAILQTYVILHQEHYDPLQLFSVCLSLLSVSLTVYLSYEYFGFDRNMNKLVAAIYEGVYVAYGVLA